jgi:Skp family chaperone for outer membrane proteins
MRLVRPPLVLGLLLAVASCQAAYYGTLEKFGIEKRDILADRVEEGREAQTEAKEQFQSALAAFQALTGFQGGDLEQVYDRLDSEYESSRDDAEEVGERIEAIESVAADLFAEWKEEIGSMQDEKLKASSRELLEDTRTRYDRMAAAMKRAAEKMEPVLVSLRDHVLYLKHNLNAKAVAALEGELVSIEGRVGTLVKEMEASIAEADAFLKSL